VQRGDANNAFFPRLPVLDPSVPSIITHKPPAKIWHLTLPRLTSRTKDSRGQETSGFLPTGSGWHRSKLPYMAPLLNNCTTEQAPEFPLAITHSCRQTNYTPFRNSQAQSHSTLLNLTHLQTQSEGPFPTSRIVCPRPAPVAWSDIWSGRHQISAYLSFHPVTRIGNAK
jgi:hypothetical protein